MNRDASITSLSALASKLTLSEEEKGFDESDGTLLPIKIPSSFFKLINPDDPSDPIRRQVVPTVFEHTESGEKPSIPLRKKDMRPPPG